MSMMGQSKAVNSKLDLSLVVPTYNEAANVPDLVRRVQSALGKYDYELIVVDDDSSDGTADILEELKSTYPIRVVVRKNERGLASAAVTGFQYATGAVIGVMDADMQHPPEHLPDLMEEIHKGADVAVASRYSPGGGTENWSLSRRITSRAATLMARVLIGAARTTPDPLSGYFLFQREVINNVGLTPIGYKILLEILTRGNIDRVASVPYVFVERKKGRSKFNVSEQLNYLRHLLALTLGQRHKARSRGANK